MNTPSAFKQRLIDIGLKVPVIRDHLARKLHKANTPYGLAKIAERIVHPDSGYTYQIFRNDLCDLVRGKFKGQHAEPAIDVLKKGYLRCSAQKEKEIEDAGQEPKNQDVEEEPKNQRREYVSMVTIRYAVNDVLAGTDNKPILDTIAADLQYEWNTPTLRRALNAFGERAKTEYLDNLLPLLTAHTFDVRSTIAETLAGTDSARAQCAMVDALMDTCRVRMEDCAASMWDDATETIQGVCTALLGTHLSREATALLQDGLKDKYAAFFCLEILATGRTGSPEQVAEHIIDRDPDQDMKMEMMEAEIMAKFIVEKEARAEGIAQVDWDDERWERRWEELVQEILFPPSR